MSQERLEGLGLMLLGLAGLALIVLVQQAPWFHFRFPGLPASFAPAVSPLWCLLVPVLVGALCLCAVGLKKVLLPDDWQPPKHLE